MIIAASQHQYNGMGSWGSEALSFVKKFGTDVVTSAASKTAGAIARKLGGKGGGSAPAPPPATGLAAIPKPVLIGGALLGGLLLFKMLRR